MKKYQVILADCPWGYNNFREKCNGSPVPHYPALKDKDIISLPVSNISDKDSLLFMWVTWPKLEIGMNAMKAWGFKYVTCIHDWVKENQLPESRDRPYCGIGHWTRGGSEPVLLGRRGKGLKRRPLKEVTELQVHHAPVGEHSVKPIEIFRKIESLLGSSVVHGNAIELFARTKQPGWDATGLDLDGVDIRDFLKVKQTRKI